MKYVVCLALALVTAGSLVASDADRVKELEKRVKQLEAQAAQTPAEAAQKKRADEQRAKAKVRMRKDRDVYSRQELQEIEALYQVANKQWRTQAGIDSLKKLVDKYDKANRTGCALLYLGQMSKGVEKAQYLKQAIEGFSDCFYGDGVQVGAYARLHLAGYYKETGNEAEAEKLRAEVAADYPDAIDHRGRPVNR